MGYIDVPFPFPRYNSSSKVHYHKTSGAKRRKTHQGGSHSHSETKTKSSKLVDISSHDDASRELFHIHLGRGYKSEKLFGKWTYYHTYTHLDQNQAGIDGGFDGPVILSKPQLTTSIKANTTLFTNGDFAQNPFDMNPYQAMTGSGVLSSIIQPAPDYCHITDALATYTISNFSAPAAVEVDCMWMLCKKNSNYSPGEMWSRALAAKALGQGVFFQPTTITAGALTGQVTGYPQIGNNAGTSFGGAVPQTIGTSYVPRGLTPFAEREFNKYWKCVQRRKFILQPGDSKKMICKIHYHKTLSKAFLSDSGVNYLKGMTIIPLVVYRPFPLKDTKAADSVVTIPSCEIGTIFDCKFNFQACKSAEARLEYNRYNDQYVANTTAADIKGINTIDIVEALTNI